MWDMYAEFETDLQRERQVEGKARPHVGQGAIYVLARSVRLAWS
jgi:hypothetical protein